MNILCKVFGHVMKPDSRDRPAGAKTCERCGHKEPGATVRRRPTWPPDLKTRG